MGWLNIHLCQTKSLMVKKWSCISLRVVIISRNCWKHGSPASATVFLGTWVFSLWGSGWREFAVPTSLRRRRVLIGRCSGLLLRSVLLFFSTDDQGSRIFPLWGARWRGVAGLAIVPASFRRRRVLIGRCSGLLLRSVLLFFSTDDQGSRIFPPWCRGPAGLAIVPAPFWRRRVLIGSYSGHLLRGVVLSSSSDDQYRWLGRCFIGGIRRYRDNCIYIRVTTNLLYWGGRRSLGTCHCADSFFWYHCESSGCLTGYSGRSIVFVLTSPLSFIDHKSLIIWWRRRTFNNPSSFHW